MAGLHNQHCMDKKKTMPYDWRWGIIVPFWKNKGNEEVCSNHRGITLLSIPGKLFAMILLERIRPTFHNHCRSEQVGFTAGRSTTEQIFALRQIIEKSKEYISLPTLLLSTSKLPLTQCPVIPCGKFFKSVAPPTQTFCSCASIVHRHPQCGAPRFFSVRRVHHWDWREARLSLHQTSSTV